MSKVSKRVLTASAVAGAALVGVVGTAGAANAGALPGAHKTKNIPGGSVSIRLFDESYSIQRAVTNVPTSREVFVSGKVRVTTNGVSGGNVSAGYLVGCQLNFGASSDGGAGIGVDTPIGGPPDFSGIADSDGTSLGAGGGFTLSPGEAGYFPVIKASIGGESVDSFTFGSDTGGIAYSQERFGVDGCAGHAEAMARITVKVATDEFKGNITVYGKPFTLG